MRFACGGSIRPNTRRFRPTGNVTFVFTVGNDSVISVHTADDTRRISA